MHRTQKLLNFDVVPSGAVIVFFLIFLSASCSVSYLTFLIAVNDFGLEAQAAQTAGVLSTAFVWLIVIALTLYQQRGTKDKSRRPPDHLNPREAVVAELVQQICEKLRITPPRLLISTKFRRRYCWTEGLRRPYTLVMESVFLRDLSRRPQLVDAVIRHELAHVLNNDARRLALMRMMYSVLQVFLVFAAGVPLAYSLVEAVKLYTKSYELGLRLHIIGMILQQAVSGSVVPAFGMLVFFRYCYSAAIREQELGADRSVALAYGTTSHIAGAFGEDYGLKRSNIRFLSVFKNAFRLAPTDSERKLHLLDVANFNKTPAMYYIIFGALTVLFGDALQDMRVATANAETFNIIDFVKSLSRLSGHVDEQSILESVKASVTIASGLLKVILVGSLLFRDGVARFTDGRGVLSSALRMAILYLVGTVVGNVLWVGNLNEPGFWQLTSQFNIVRAASLDQNDILQAVAFFFGAIVVFKMCKRIVECFRKPAPIRTILWLLLLFYTSANLIAAIMYGPAIATGSKSFGWLPLGSIVFDALFAVSTSMFIFTIGGTLLLTRSHSSSIDVTWKEVAIQSASAGPTEVASASNIRITKAARRNRTLKKLALYGMFVVAAVSVDMLITFVQDQYERREIAITIHPPNAGESYDNLSHASERLSIAFDKYFASEWTALDFPVVWRPQSCVTEWRVDCLSSRLRLMLDTFDFRDPPHRIVLNLNQDSHAVLHITVISGGRPVTPKSFPESLVTDQNYLTYVVYVAGYYFPYFHLLNALNFPNIVEGDLNALKKFWPDSDTMVMYGRIIERRLKEEKLRQDWTKLDEDVRQKAAADLLAEEEAQIASHPRLEPAWINVISANEVFGHYDEAIGDAQKGLALMPESGPLHAELALALLTRATNLAEDAARIDSDTVRRACNEIEVGLLLSNDRRRVPTVIWAKTQWKDAREWCQSKFQP